MSQRLLALLLPLVLSLLAATEAEAATPNLPRDVVPAALLTPRAEGRLIRVPAAGAVAKPAPEKSPWTYALGLAFSMAQGNSDTFDLTTDGLAKLDQDPWQLSLKAVFAYGEKDGSRSTEALHVTVHAERKLSKRVYLFGNVDYSRDVPAGLVYRWTPVGGLGFVLLDKPGVTVKGEVGGGYAIEKRLGQGETADPAAYLGLDYAKTWKDGATLTMNAKFVPNLGDFDLSVVTWDMKFAKPLSGVIDLTVSLRVDYVFQPPAPAESTDILLAVGLRANF